MDIRIYFVWLQERLGRGNPKTAALLREWEHPRYLYEADRKALADRGVGGRWVDALADKSLENAERIWEEAQKQEVWLMTPDDPRYPASLLTLPDFPVVLYGKGDFPEDWDQRLSLTVVGTRRLSTEDAGLTASLTAGLVACGIAVVTGAAPGADEIVAATAADLNGCGISVLACGHAVNYPRQTEETRMRLLQNGGVILSEYAPRQPGGEKGCYILRNRLLSGLTAGTVVTAAPARSGTLITARSAREQGRDVFAVPGDEQGHAGCHTLIKEGALLVTECTDVLREYESRFLEWPDFEAARRIEQEVRAAYGTGRKPLVHTEEVSPRSKPKRTTRPENTATKSDDLSTLPSQTASGRQWERPQIPEGLTTEAKTVFQVLGEQALPLDEIARHTGLSSACLLVAMTELEMTGTVQNSAGGHYRLKG